MAHAVNSALRAGRAANRRLALVLGDIVDGFMSTSRFVVTFVGCVTLLGGAVILSNDTARARFIEHAPAVVGHWLVPAANEVVAAASAAEAQVQQVSLQVVLPEQRFITQYLSRRYRVADEAVRRLVSEAYKAGENHVLDPTLILAVMAVESSMNPFAESSVGAQGLMQVMTRVHTDKFEMHGGDSAALDPIANIHVGSAILKDLIRRGGSVERGLQLYVGAGNMPDDGGYGARVLGERSRIQLAATGKVDAALAAGLRSDAARLEARAAPVAPAPAATVAPVSAGPDSSDPAGKAAERAA